MYFSTGAQLQAALNALPESKKGSYVAFDAFFYGQQYMQDYSGNLSPIEHFVQIGASRGNMPNATFNPNFYANQYADLRGQGFDAADLLYHYMTYGLDEGRAGNAELLNFSAASYFAQNPDVEQFVNDNLDLFNGSATNGAIAHYVKFGQAEGRQFATDAYTLQAGIDVAAANVFSAPRGWTPGGTDQVNTLDDDDVLTGVGPNPTLDFNFVRDADIGGGANTVITPTMNGVETINTAFSGSAGNYTLDLQDTTGVQNINATRIAEGLVAHFRNISEAGANNLSISNSQSGNNNVLFTYLAGALRGTADEVNLTLSNALTNIIQVEALNQTQGFETMNLVSTGSPNSANVLQTEDLRTLNISGDADLRLGQQAATVRAGTNTVESFRTVAGLANVAGSLTVIDASAFEGDLDLAIGNEINVGLDGTSGLQVQMAITGGAGNDIFRLTDGATVGGAANNTDVIDGGAGNNTVVISGTAAINAAATPNVRNIQALEIRTGHDAGVAADVVNVNANAFNALASIYVRNEGQDQVLGVWQSAAEIMTVNLTNLTAAQAQAITIAHGSTGNSDIANNNLNYTFAAAATNNASTVTIVDGINNDPVFNFRLGATSSELVTLVDNDTESNTVHINQGVFTQAGSTITLQSGAAGQYMNLDSFGGASVGAGGSDGYGYATTGVAGSSTTASAAAAAIAGVPAAVSASTRDNAVNSVLFGAGVVLAEGAATRHLVENIVATDYAGDVVVRLGDLTRADGVTSMNIRTGSGNDTFIFDALGLTSAGFTSGDTIAAGAGTDTLVIDGNTATIPGTPRIDHQASEWDNLTGIDVLRFAQNQGVANVGTGARVANAGGGYYARIDNDFVAQTDAGNRLTVINNDGVLNQNTESDLVLDLRGLSQNMWVTFVGANGVGGGGLSSNRIVVDDVSANQNMILNGGDTDVRVSTTGGYVAGNNNVYEVRNTANVSIADLSQTSNFGLINFTNDQAVAQTLTLTLNNTIVEQMVDSSNTATSAATQEVLAIVATDQGGVASILNIDARQVEGFRALNVTGSVAGADVVALNANVGGTAHDVLLGATAGDRVNWVGTATNITIELGTSDGVTAGDSNGWALFQTGAVTTTHDMDDVEIVDISGMTYTTSTIGVTAAAERVILGAGADTVQVAGGESTLAAMDTITGFTAGTDAIDLVGVAGAIGTVLTVQDLTAQASLAAAVDAAAAANAVAQGVSIFHFGGNTYVYVEALGGGGAYVAGDTLIELTGVIGNAGVTTVAGFGVDGL